MAEQNNKSAVFQATEHMLKAMEDLREKKITPAEANSIALLGKGVCDMAREATNFARVTGYLPVETAFGDKIRPLEPFASKEALDEQKARLEAHGVKILPPNRKTA